MNAIGRTSELNTTPNYQAKAQPAKQETKAPESKPVTASADQALGNYGKAMINSHTAITGTYLNDKQQLVAKYADGTEMNLGKTKLMYV